MTVIKQIRQHISYLHMDSLIFTRDMLQHGTRYSVDMCLHRLTASGFLKRLYFGIYVRSDCTRSFSTEELADAKRIWLVQKKLDKLLERSPGLILSRNQKYDQDANNFAPPLARPAITISDTQVNRPAFFSDPANRPSSWVSR